MPFTFHIAQAAFGSVTHVAYRTDLVRTDGTMNTMTELMCHSAIQYRISATATPEDVDQMKPTCAKCAKVLARRAERQAAAA